MRTFRLAFLLCLFLYVACGMAGMRHLDGSRLSIPSPVGMAPPSRPATVDDLMQLRDMADPAISPDGRLAAVLVNEPDARNDSYRVAWFIVSLVDRTPPINAGDAGEPDFLSPSRRNLRLVAKWSPDGRWIAYLRQMDGAVQVWRSRSDGTGQQRVTNGAADVIDFAWLTDGRGIVFSTDASRDELASAMRAEARLGSLVTPDGARRPQQRRFELTGGRPRMWVHDLRSDKESPAEEGQIASYRSEVERATRDPKRYPSLDGRSVAIAEIADRRKVRADPPRKLSLSRGTEVLHCPDPRCEGYIEDTWWREDDKAIYFRRRANYNHPGFSILEWEIERGAVRAVFESRDTVTGCAVAGLNLICLRQTPTWPRTLVSICLKDGAIKTLFDPNPQWSQVRLGETTWLTWADREGHPTYGVLVKPVDYVEGRRYPLVLIGYWTGNAVRGDVAARYPTHVLSAQGFVSLVFDHWRSEDNYHRPLGEWLVQSYGGDVPLARISFQQLESVIDLLSEQGLVDPARVGIGGHSNGLNVAAYGLIHSNRFKAAALAWIRWNPTKYYTAETPFYKPFREASLIRPIEGSPSALTRNLSLAWNASRVRAPILVHASEREFAEESQMEAVIRFRDAGKPLEMHVFRDEGHIFFHPAHRDTEYRRNTQWFQFWLQGKEEDDPVDAGQYVRWRNLRSMLDAPAATTSGGSAR